MGWLLLSLWGLFGPCGGDGFLREARGRYVADIRLIPPRDMVVYNQDGMRTQSTVPGLAKMKYLAPEMLCCTLPQNASY